MLIGHFRNSQWMNLTLRIIGLGCVILGEEIRKYPLSQDTKTIFARVNEEFGLSFMEH